MMERKILPGSLTNKITVPFLRPALQVQKILAAEKPGWAIPLIAYLAAGALQAGMAERYRGIESQTDVNPAGILFAIVGAAAGILIFWLVESEVFNILLLLNGGRTSITQVKALTAWAYFPFVVREIERSVYMLATGRAIQNPGLSAAAGPAETFGGIWLQSSLGQIDVFFCWHLVFILIAAKAVLGKNKAGLTAAIIFGLLGWVLLKGAALAGFSLLTQ